MSRAHHNPPSAGARRRSIEQRWQLGLVAPLGVLVVAGVIFVHIADGPKAALHFLFVQILALLVAAAIGRALSRQFLFRLDQLRRRAERLEAGRYEPLPVDSGDDEFGDLARAFNHMIKVIASREAAQRDQNMALAEVNRQMETVLDATNDGIALIDKEGRFALVNRRFCEMLGTRPEALLNRPVTEAQLLLTGRLAKPERLLGRLGPFTAQDLTHPIGVAEEVIEVVAAERRFIQVYTAPVRDENHGMTGRLLALHDITRETEVDRMKTDFISVVSHELRTPLTSIKGYTELLLTEQAGPISELQREFLGILQGSATRLNNLINDILDISRLESGRIEVRMEPIEYEEVVADVLRLMKAAADEKQISIDAGLPGDEIVVRGDPDKVTQILTNLLSNAIKYTPRGGWVKVSLERSGASIITCVADNGIGISPDDQKKLFQKFFRADNSSTREAGGTGLGLAIVKTMIELLGGAIWVESEPDKGCRFYFTLPLYTQPPQIGESAEHGDGALGIAAHEVEAALGRGAARNAGPASAKLVDRGLGLVLLVDDDVYIREQLQHALHRMGYGVMAGSELDEVLRRARVHRPDVILLDMMMTQPDMAGFAILRALQDDPATATLPIVAYSLAGDPAHGPLALGAFSFLRKPVEHAMLVKSLHEHFGKHRELALLMIALCETDDALCAAEADAESLRAGLLQARITLTLESRAERALSLAIERRPDAILLDEDACSDPGALFTLLKALKSEEDLSRIPLILLTKMSARAVEHVHLGSDAAEMSETMDYLGEQIAGIVRGREIKRPTTPRKA